MKKIFLMFAFLVHVILRSHAAAGVANCPFNMTGDTQVETSLSLR